VLVDRSGSMTTENNALVSGLADVADALTCPPGGSGGRRSLQVRRCHRNFDALPDPYVSVAAGTPMCWLVAVKDNLQVVATNVEQVFVGTVEIRGDGALLSTQTLSFVVPAATPVPTLRTPVLLLLIVTIVLLGTYMARGRIATPLDPPRTAP